MPDRALNFIDYDSLIRSWERDAPWHRRVLARIGLQGKIIFTFSCLLLLALVGCYVLYVSESGRMLERLTGESAIEIAQTLAKVSETELARGNRDELTRIGKDLLRNPDIIAVAFFDAAGTPVAVACEDPDYAARHPGLLTDPRQNTQQLMQARRRSAPVLGDFVEVTAPVVVLNRGADAAGGSRLVGYVSVSRTDKIAKAHLHRARTLVIVVGGLVFLLSMPVVFLMVYRIFHPIRQLVGATRRIADGDLGVEVAVHRPDTIGALARSFNEMVQRVKQQQQALADANRDLEERIRQRTAQLENANQRLSGEIAEKEDFLRAVSHDLNAPLRNISGMAAMLLLKYRGELNEDMVHRLERIVKNVQVETDLINELLELSRIKTRRQKMEPIATRNLLDDLAGIFENDLRTRDISLVFETPLPTLHAERARIRQVFQNLIDNAIKYMGEESDRPTGRTIRVGALVRPGEVEFYVADSGVGIDPEDQARIFFVFRRGRNSSGRQVAGKGVGLASVKSIVETYGGRIWVESRPGAGSTFRFTINGQYAPEATAHAA